jgi:sugar (pentulose or hexulose) kinase
VTSIFDPANPVQVGYHDTPCWARGVAVSGEYVYVADWTCGLWIYQLYGMGVQETTNDERGTMKVGPTVVRGVLLLPGSQSASSSCLMDISGRKVMDLRPGANGVRALAPGVYFVREAQAQAQAQAVRKVVITE